MKSELTIISGVDHNLIGQTHERTRVANIAAVQQTFDFIDKTIGDNTNIARLRN